MAVRDILSHDEQLCEQRGVRLTPQRKQVLRIIMQSEFPLGAYEILQKMEQPAAPPTVYRALDFLLQQGLIHRLETLQAYLVCDHPDASHQSQFLICSECGRVKEMEDRNIRRSLDSAASEAGFSRSNEVVEIIGRCGRCAGAGH
ncbi:MAG: transcriptional repressor [Pseudomonadota bacterium]